MSQAQNLPTEILCSIFEMIVAEVALEADFEGPRVPEWSPAPISPMSDAVSRPSAHPADPVANCTIPSQKDCFLHCVTLSHVCSRWRYVAIELPSLWTRVYLGHRAFFGHHPDDDDAAEMTDQILTRSAALSICLDIALAPGDSSRLSAKSISRALLPNVARIHALKIAGSQHLITAVLDVFLECNLKASSNQAYTSLSRLQLSLVENDANGLVTDKANAHHPFFPPDLSLISPYLSSLRIDGLQVGSFPRWRLQNIVLENTHLSWKNHFHLLAKTPANKFVLNRVTIPTGGPYVRHLQPHANTSSVTFLSLSDLRCDAPEHQRKDMYRTFFALSLYTDLQELIIAHLSREAMAAFLAIFGSNHAVTLSAVHRLVLRRVKVNARAGETLAGALPLIREMRLDDVEGSDEFISVWKHNVAFWPQLTEIALDGEVLQRAS